MNTSINDALVAITTRFHRRRQLARRVLFIVGMLLVMAITVITSRPALLTDLAQGHQLHKVNFFPLWGKGDLVVLMRHAERCDRSTNPCLAQPDGITVKGQHVADQLGQALQKLGLNQATLYNSPMRRTEQTSAYAFNHTTPGQDWLINCRDSMLDEVLKHKLDGHNMVLVTHSECIVQLEKSLDISAPGIPDYASSLIVSVNPDNHHARVLGYIDAADWGRVLRERP